MSYPPPAPGAPARGNPTLKILLVVIVFIGIPCVGGGWFFFNLFKQGVKTVSTSVLPTVSCAYSFEQAREALRAYAKDHDGRLPAAETWEDDVRLYFAKATANPPGGGRILDQDFQIEPFPADGPWGCRVDGEVKTGIALNAELAGKVLADIPEPTRAVLLFEVPEVGKNLARAYEAPPASQAPRLFGQPRDWMKLYVEGEGPFTSEEFGPSNLPTPPDAPEAPEAPAAPATPAGT